jgi:hypothetical protein
MSKMAMKTKYRAEDCLAIQGKVNKLVKLSSKEKRTNWKSSQGSHVS